ncbi:MAG: hypothetical protein OXT63_04385 [Gemmatimonadota bacterium]|nr:hypothetical protein [Gemmatimonadota bacterium]
MSNLTAVERRYLEKLLRMDGGYVLDYTNATFAEFFDRFDVPIHDPQYTAFGTSKAKKLRAFWAREADGLVGAVLHALLDDYEAECILEGREKEVVLLEKCREIAARLSGRVSDKATSRAAMFLTKEFPVPEIASLSLDPQMSAIIENRLDELRRVFDAGAFLAVVIISGSVLEGLLLGVAQAQPERFNRSPASPKSRDGKVRRFQRWSLAQLIDVACREGVLDPDVREFSHGLRNFRNYIHPYEQRAEGFKPDEDTAKVCYQVLLAALADLRRLGGDLPSAEE